MIDTENRDRPMCPWCGAPHDYDDTIMPCGEDKTCCHCGQKFHVVKNTTITYTTSKIAPPLMRDSGLTVLPEDDEPTRKWKEGCAEALKAWREDPNNPHTHTFPETYDMVKKRLLMRVKAPLPLDVTRVTQFMADRMKILEQGHLEFEKGLEMTDEQCATLNEALGINMGQKKGKDYRPYCLRCTPGPRVALTAKGFQCWACGNEFGFDLIRHDVPPG
jgi:hypothetical protein